MNDKPKSRCVGLIGGLGVGATVHYYQELAKAQEAEGQPLDLVMVHADMRRVFGHVQARDIDGLAQYLAQLIARLQDGGADIAAVSAVMPHICASELMTLSPLPLVNLLQSVEEEIRARGLHRLALFGTRFTMEADLFGHLKEVQVFTPEPEEVEYIHNTYFQLASTGRGAEEHRRGLTTIAHKLCERDGLDAILLAGTDLSLVFNEDNTEFPHVDCARVHIKSIVHALRSNPAAGL